MALSGGHSTVPYYWQGTTFHCWLTSLEMLMAHTHGWNKYGCEYTVQNNRVIWGKHRLRHTQKVRELKGFMGVRCSLSKGIGAGARYEQIADDYALRPVDTLMGCRSIAEWRKRLKKSPILAEGHFGPAMTGVGGHAVLFVGWSTRDRLVYQDPFTGVRGYLSTDAKYSYLTVDQVAERTRYNRNSCFWRSL
ncbi:MAG: papain-like cysteine protease family protein [Pseudomonadota bacterium]